MTNQEKFFYLDKIVEGLKIQGSLSMEGNTKACKYRMEDGRRCAIGQLIPHSIDVSSIEGKSLEYDPIKIISIMKQAGLPTDDDAISFFKDMQAIHDNSDSLEQALEKYQVKRNLIL